MTQPNRPSPEEESQLRQEEQTQAQAARLGADEAAENSPMANMDPEDFLDSLRDPDITSPEFSEIEDVLGPYLSGQHVTTYHDPDDREKLELLNMALTKRVIKERNHGRLCTGPFLEVAQRVDGRDDKSVKQKWTDDERAAIRTSLMEVRTAMQYLGINHTGLSKTADTHIETQMRRVDDSESQSRLGKAQKRFFG
ncbi:hypothetical protein [Halostella sp. PRR32]|uniref:hypothetical protein n=1 Tax=Halostella sp. PRR32 TaxID=3098147 RepID=UPI00110D8B8B|nr:hypothetical protein [Halostella sp. PRR32]